MARTADLIQELCGALHKPTAGIRHRPGDNLLLAWRHAIAERRKVPRARMHRHLSRTALRANEAPMLGDVDGI